ncbi:MAG TPA: hypothetical protein VFL61_16535 [Gaiellaceae bacterium]|nr:hypothetical protein [Gaiellaceae bacterium]HET8652626.1 hypothetical protein [Gaiellaceae bacterium]HEU6446660.1 hypothetical protein [Gaiellaceae bacterium]
MASRFSADFLVVASIALVLGIASRVVSSDSWAAWLSWAALAASIIALVMLIRTRRHLPPRASGWPLRIAAFGGWIVFAAGWIARGPWWSYLMIIGGGVAGAAALAWRLSKDEREGLSPQ